MSERIKTVRPIHALAALCLGIGLGLGVGQLRAADEHAAHDRDAAVLKARAESCEDALTADYDEVQRLVVGQCEVAAAACATVAESAVAVEQVARGLLWLAPGPRVER